MDNQHANIVKLGHRAAHAHAHAHAHAAPVAVAIMDPIMNIELPTRLLEARADTTTSSTPTGSCGVNPCEKGVSDQSMTLPIILGVA